MKILLKQTSLFTEEKLTCLPGDSLANRTALQESEKEKRMNAIFGQKCLEQYERLNQSTLWGKMFSELLIGTMDWYSTRCKLTWRLKGTKYNRLYFQLQVLTHPTKETECGLLLTPTTIERAEEPEKMRARAEKNGYKNGTQYNSLMSQIVYGNFLPTPVTSDATTGAIIGKNDKFVITKTGMPRKINQKGTDGSVGLARLGKLGMLPTPTTRDYKGARSKEALKKAGRTETNSLPDTFAQTGKSSQLKPQFVMEMMGFPPDWTLLPFLNGEQKV